MDLALIILVTSVVLLTFAYWWFRQRSTKAKEGEKEEK